MQCLPATANTVGPLCRIRGIARLPPIGTGPHADRMSVSDATPIISHAGSDGTLAETIFDMKAGTTLLAVAHPDGTNEIGPVLELADGARLVPYSATNNLLATRCVLLPSSLGDVGDTRLRWARRGSTHIRNRRVPGCFLPAG